MDNTVLFAETNSLCSCVYETEIIKLVQNFAAVITHMCAAELPWFHLCIGQHTVSSPPPEGSVRMIRIGHSEQRDCCFPDAGGHHVVWLFRKPVVKDTANNVQEKWRERSW